jgi:putative ABC transport system permease protein
VIIAAFGIVSTLILSVTERKRELGLMRAVGMTRPQTAFTIVIESIVVALLGTLVGMVFGLFVAFMAVRPIFADGKTSFTWPVGQLLFILAVGVGLGAIAPSSGRLGRSAQHLDSIASE